MAAILEECQIYLGGGERLTKMAVINGKTHYISTISRINKVLWTFYTRKKNTQYKNKYENTYSSKQTKRRTMVMMPIATVKKPR